MDKTIATIPKNAREEVRVALCEFNGHDLFAVRVFTDPAGATGDRVPTRKGLTASIRLLPDIIRALTKAEAEAKAAGLLQT
jgi:hypothetical protein